MQQPQFSPNPQPHLVITEQPKEKGYRYRYKSEGLTHGGILGASSEGDRKTFPTVEIQNYKGYAQITAQLVTVDAEPRLHPHSLTGKHCNNGVCTVTCGPTDMTATFPNLGIQRVTKKNAEETLKNRYLENATNERGLATTSQLDPGTYESCCQRAKREAEAVSLTAVRLMFVAYLRDESSQSQTMLQAVVSESILDCKATNLCPLKISRISRTSGSVSGNDEIWILCEKVQKDDIKIRFYEEQNDKEIWSAYGDFFPTDVHKQVAIVFKTPAYRDIMIAQPVNVLVQLQRSSDHETSSSQKFTYIPVQPIEGLGNQVTQMKAFTHGCNGLGPNKPKKKPIFKAPNPQKMPIDPTHIMNMQKQQQGVKRRRVEAQPQYWQSTGDGGVLDSQLLIVEPSNQNPFPQQYLQNDNTNYNMQQVSAQTTMPYQTYQQNTAQNTIMPGTSASTSTTFTPMSSVSATTTIDHSVLGDQQMYTQNFEGFVDLAANAGGGGDRHNIQQSVEEVDSMAQEMMDLIKEADMHSEIRTDSAKLANGETIEDDEDDFMPSFPMDKIMSVQSDSPVVLEQKINNLSVSDTKSNENEMSELDYRKTRIEHYVSVLCERISRDDLYATLSRSKQSLLHRAVSTNNHELVKEILKDGFISVNHPDSRGFSAIHIAAFNNQSDMLKLLLSHCDGNPLTYDFNGNSPMHVAAITDTQACIDVMVANGNSVNISNGKTGNTTLHIAVETKNLPLVKFLIEKCAANVEMQNYNGHTPLHIAAGSDSITIAQYLLDHGAHKDTECSEVRDSTKNYDEDGYGMTPIDFATSEEMKQLLSAEKLTEVDANQSLDDSIELMDPLVRHQFCVLMNKSDSDRLKLAETCAVDQEEMKKQKNQTEYLLDHFKGRISSLGDHLSTIGRADAADLIMESL